VKVIENVTIRYDFLLMFYSNYGSTSQVPQSGNLFFYSVAKNQHFALAEKPWTGSKNGCHLLTWAEELYHHAKFGEDRNTRAGRRCENVVFIFCHALSPYSAECSRGA